MAKNQSAKTARGTLRKRPLRPGEGKPPKHNPELLQAILGDLALGLTREQACASNGCSLDAFEKWEKLPQYVGLRAAAEAARIKALMAQLNSCMGGFEGGGDWKRFAWYLERTFKTQFADPAKMALSINQTLNQQNNSFAYSTADIEGMRQRLEEIKARQIKWRANGTQDRNANEPGEREGETLDSSNSGSLE